MGKNEELRATGRRKNAIAQVRLLAKGDGKITVNKKPVDEYFKGLPHQVRDVRSPIELIEGSKSHDYILKVIGGGISGHGSIELIFGGVTVCASRCDSRRM